MISHFSDGGSRRGSRDTGGVAEKYYKPVFRKVPADIEVRDGELVRFDCVVSGRPMPEIFWYLEGVQVHDDALHKIVVNESGIFSLIIHSTRNTDAGQYTCIARNRGGEDQFQVHLNVLGEFSTMAILKFQSYLKTLLFNPIDLGDIKDSETKNLRIFLKSFKVYVIFVFPSGKKVVIYYSYY